VGPVVEQPLSQLEEVLNTNLVGVVRLTQASYSCSQLASQQGGGSGMLRSPHALRMHCAAPCRPGQLNANSRLS
jgi:hypothetical protein